MAQYESRMATSSDVSALYDLLNECVIEEHLGKEFTNSKKSFEKHFNEGLFKAFIIEVADDTGHKTDRPIIGCAFLSFCYSYSTGQFSWLHCGYIKPNFRNRGIEQKSIKYAKKVSVDEGIPGMMMTIDGSDVTKKSALESMGGINMTALPKGASDFWFTPNPSSTPEFSNNDYVIREATSNDLGAVYLLLRKLIEGEGLAGLMRNTKEDLERDGHVDRDLYGSVILEHRLRVDDLDTESTFKYEIVGCMLYSKAYYVLKGNTYCLQGLYILPNHKGKGLGKALVQATLKICLDRNGDGFIYMILQDNIVSQSLFGSLQGTNWTKSKHIEPYVLKRSTSQNSS